VVSRFCDSEIAEVVVDSTMHHEFASFLRLVAFILLAKQSSA